MAVLSRIDLDTILDVRLRGSLFSCVDVQQSSKCLYTPARPFHASVPDMLWRESSGEAPWRSCERAGGTASSLLRTRRRTAVTSTRADRGRHRASGSLLQLRLLLFLGTICDRTLLCRDVLSGIGRAQLAVSSQPLPQGSRSGRSAMTVARSTLAGILTRS